MSLAAPWARQGASPRRRWVRVLICCVCVFVAGILHSLFGSCFVGLLGSRWSRRAHVRALGHSGRWGSARPACHARWSPRARSRSVVRNARVSNTSDVSETFHFENIGPAFALQCAFANEIDYNLAADWNMSAGSNALTALPVSSKSRLCSGSADGPGGLAGVYFFCPASALSLPAVSRVCSFLAGWFFPSVVLGSSCEMSLGNLRQNVCAKMIQADPLAHPLHKGVNGKLDRSRLSSFSPYCLLALLPSFLHLLPSFLARLPPLLSPLRSLLSFPPPRPLPRLPLLPSSSALRSSLLSLPRFTWPDFPLAARCLPLPASPSGCVFLRCPFLFLPLPRKELSIQCKCRVLFAILCVSVHLFTLPVLT